MTASAPAPPPVWDLESLFPTPDGPEAIAALAAIREETAALAALFDSRGVRRREIPEVDAAVVCLYDEATARLNALYQAIHTLGSYAGCLVAANAADEAAQRLASQVRLAWVPISQLGTRYTAWTGTLDQEALLPRSATARAHEHTLRQARIYAAHQMAEGEEELAAELDPSGIGGWARLHADYTALLSVPIVLGGEATALPMSAVRNLANDADREIRRTAYHAELAAWRAAEVPLAAALNGVKGAQDVLRRRRGWRDPVEPTLTGNGIDAATLAAMQEACQEAFPELRRYLRAKARLLGEERLPWYDLFAPVGTATREYSWAEAEALILEQFGRYSPRMQELAARSFRERWIDAPPRPGKEGGAFCSSVRPGESRILMNFDGSFSWVSTLAHELGHAYHNHCLEQRTPLQSETPSTLAETASIFCETLVYEAVLERATGEERLALLDASLQHHLQVVVDIHSRYLFERAVFQERATHELSPSELCGLMLDAQERTYGDGLAPDCRHPYMWAVKGHYYGPTFYNYPYTFGLLFALGLYTRFRADPAAFRASYDELLASTGMADAATLAARYGIDLRSGCFWRESLGRVRDTIRAFEELTAPATSPQ